LSKVAYFNLPACIWSMSTVATGKQLAGSSCHLVRRYRPYPRPHCARWGTQLPSQKKGHSSPPLFGPCLLWPNGRPSQQLLSSCAKWIHTAFFDHIPLEPAGGEGGYIVAGQSFPYATSHRTALFRQIVNRSANVISET